MDQERKAYERFRLQWMLDHGRTLSELIGELQKLRDEGDPEMSLQALFRDWEFGYGFGSEIWPCYEEFLGSEYPEMKSGMEQGVHKQKKSQNRRGTSKGVSR